MEFFTSFAWIVIIVILIIIIYLRRVVPTNEVHIIQKWSSSTPHWKWFKWWNTYLAFPSWVPFFWVAIQKLPLSVFDLQLNWYKAYDSWKVPFIVDITAFFNINQPEMAAQKIYTMWELKDQLNETLKWVVRKVLASKDIIEIMESRKEIKDEFYAEVLNAVKEWWVDSKNVEFMDIRDPSDWSSQVISNIMMKKRSQIEADSKIEVAENQKRAIIEKENKESEARAKAAEAKARADIISSDALRESEVKRIENEKLTQNKDIEKEKLLAVQKEEAKQKVYESEKVTKEKELDVKKVESEKNAEIAKSIELIKADEQKQKSIIDAEAEKETITIQAQADKTKVELEAEADKTKVDLEAQAEKNRIESIWLAKAKEIDYLGTAEAKNKTEMAKALNSFSNGSLWFLVKELEVKLSEVVDLEKAKALNNADVKVISTWSNGGEWVKNFMDLFSAKWWTNLWAMLESLKNTVWEDKVNDFLSKVKSGQKS